MKYPTTWLPCARAVIPASERPEAACGAATITVVKAARTATRPARGVMFSPPAARCLSNWYVPIRYLRHLPTPLQFCQISQFTRADAELVLSTWARSLASKPSDEDWYCPKALRRPAHRSTSRTSRVLQEFGAPASASGAASARLDVRRRSG